MTTGCGNSVAGRGHKPTWCGDTHDAATSHVPLLASAFHEYRRPTAHSDQTVEGWSPAVVDVGLSERSSADQSRTRHW